MFMRTGQPGLWFIAGSLAQCRIYSKYLGLQIKACEVGLLGANRNVRAAQDVMPSEDHLMGAAARATIGALV